MTIRAIGGLVGLNIAFVSVGLALLFGFGALRRWSDLLRLAGVAYFTGVASAMVVLTLELVVGMPVDLGTSVASLAALAAAALVAGLRRSRGRRLARPTLSIGSTSIFVASCFAGLVVYFEALFRASRLSPTLAEWDGWSTWVPKAKAIYFFGHLDPSLLAFTPGPSYPPGLPAVHALAFHAMGSPDDVTLHLQYWHYALAFTAAVGGLLASRVRGAILLPVLMAALVAPSFITRLTWTYADLPLGYLVALAALLLGLWLSEREEWQLAFATILLGGAMLTKREGILFAACVLCAAFIGSYADRRSAWPRLGLSGLLAFLFVLPWRIWFLAHGIPSDAPSGGVLGLDDTSRGWHTVELVLTTLGDPEHWRVLPVLAALSLLLAALARAWRLSLYAAVFVVCAMVAATLTIWTESSLPLTQNDAKNPIVRMTGTSILVLVVLTPLLLERAWSAGGAVLAPSAPVGPDVFVWRTRAACSIVVLAALAYPASMLVGYSGHGLPGALPRFPSSADCVDAPAPGEKVRVVVGYARSYPRARDLRRRATRAGLPNVGMEQDGCGRVRVFVERLATVDVGQRFVAMAHAAGLGPTLERNSG
jgi:hypothetical protein